MACELGDLKELLGAASGERIGRQSDASTNFLATLDRKFLQTYTEVDPVQGSAIKEIQRPMSQFPVQGMPGSNPQPTAPG